MKQVKVNFSKPKKAFGFKNKAQSSAAASDPTATILTHTGSKTCV